MTSTEIDLITGIVTLTVLILGLVYQWFREMREFHRIESEARKVARALDKRVESLHVAVNEGTEAATKAYHEANSVNLKLEALGLKQKALEDESKK